LSPRTVAIQRYSIMRGAKAGTFSKKKGSMVGIQGAASRPLTILCDCVARGKASCPCHEYVWWSESYAELTQHLNKTATLLVATSEFKIYTLSVRTR
jgi:hypothetical protein